MKKFYFEDPPFWYRWEKMLKQQEIHSYSTLALVVTILILLGGVTQIIGYDVTVSAALITSVMALCWSYQEKMVLS